MNYQLIGNQSAINRQSVNQADSIHGRFGSEQHASSEPSVPELLQPIQANEEQKPQRQCPKNQQIFLVLGECVHTEAIAQIFLEP